MDLLLVGAVVTVAGSALCVARKYLLIIDAALEKEAQDNRDEYYLHRTFSVIRDIRKSRQVDPLDASTIGPGYEELDPEDIMLFAKKTITSGHSALPDAERVKNPDVEPLIDILRY